MEERRSLGPGLAAVITVAACVALVYLAAFGISGCPGRQGSVSEGVVEKLEQEPKVSVYFHETGQTKTMSVEDYIAGVVAGEMKPGWPTKAYAAQAILARTFTMEFLSRGGTRAIHGADICDDAEHAQAYDPAAVTDQVREAVAMTRGKVAAVGGRYIRGWFSASCGGRTALARDGLAFPGPEPRYTRRVDCPELAVIPPDELKWSATFSKADMRRALAEKGLNLGDIGRVEILKRDKTGRVTVFRIRHGGGVYDIKGANLRIALGPDKMRSIWITSMDDRGDSVHMEGRGFGHGVGMCQWGARALAERGRTPEDIIQYYFDDVRIVKVWD